MIALSKNPALGAMSSTALRVFCFVLLYRQTHGLSPKYREIEERFGLCSAMVNKAVAELSARGLVRRNFRLARSIVPLYYLELPELFNLNNSSTPNPPEGVHNV